MGWYYRKITLYHSTQIYNRFYLSTRRVKNWARGSLKEALDSLRSCFNILQSQFFFIEFRLFLTKRRVIFTTSRWTLAHIATSECCHLSIHFFKKESPQRSQILKSHECQIPVELSLWPTTNIFVKYLITPSYGAIDANPGLPRFIIRTRKYKD